MGPLAPGSDGGHVTHIVSMSYVAIRYTVANSRDSPRWINLIDALIMAGAGGNTAAGGGRAERRRWPGCRRCLRHRRRHRLRVS